MSRITVIGAGFGALTAIRSLRASDVSLQIDVIASRPEFVYFRAPSGSRPVCVSPKAWIKVYVAGDSGSFPGPEWMHLRKYR